LSFGQDKSIAVSRIKTNQCGKIEDWVMKKRQKDNDLKSNQKKSSMSNASKVICMEEECIGKLSSDQKEETTEPENNLDGDQKPTTRSSMKFGEDSSCSDEECIGKT